ncbi:MAG: redox-sensing transcriptional repressor Rex [Bacteroidales bacterium]|nr:redox-sensing transcriptional repressor Rex [Bacteroidales bacterium]
MNEKVNVNRAPDILPEPTLRRLPWYLAYLSTLKRAEVATISTTKIAEALDVDPSQIAKDLSFLGIRGKTRIGYNVDDLEQALRDYLGFDRSHNAVMMGVGSLGAALIADSGLHRYGLNIVAGVDINPNLVGTEISGVKIFHRERTARLVRDLNVKIGIIALPVEAAQEAADDLAAAGVRAIWNFTPSRIRVPEGVVISNTSIYSHLAVMYNRLSLIEQDGVK